VICEKRRHGTAEYAAEVVAGAATLTEIAERSMGHSFLEVPVHRLGAVADAEQP